MPNWCANLLEVAGSAEEKKRFLEAAHSKEDNLEYAKPSVLSLKNFVPYEGEWNYDWCVNNWGTKWDVDAELVNDRWEQEDSPYNNLVIKFESAWAPPEAALEKIANLFPTLGFRLLYAEPGMDFTGVLEYNVDYDTMEFYVTNNTPSSIVAGYIMGYSG